MQHDRQWRCHQIDHLLVGAREPALAVPWSHDQFSDRFGVVGQRPGVRGSSSARRSRTMPVGPMLDCHITQPKRLAQGIGDAAEVIPGQLLSDGRHRGYRVSPGAVDGAVDKALQAHPDGIEGQRDGKRGQLPAPRRRGELDQAPQPARHRPRSRPR